MSLSPDFGRSYLEATGENFFGDLEYRSEIVAIFRKAYEALVSIGYSPEISGLIGAYQELSAEVRDSLNNGESLGEMSGGEFVPVRKFVDSMGSFMGDQFDFAFENYLHDRDPNKTKATLAVASHVGYLYRHNLLPANMLIEYASSFTETD